MKKIFVATDFSDVSHNAINYAGEMARIFGASITLLHVYESPLFYTAEMPYTAIEAAENLAKSDAEMQMAKMLAAVKNRFTDLNITTDVKRGVSVETIVKEAEENGADLLVTGSTGAGLIERTLIGSTTTALINKSKCMILIVPEKATFTGVNSLTYTTDLHDDNIGEANKLIPLATKLNAELVFLFVDNKIHTDSEAISDEMSSKIKSIIKYPKLSGYVCTDPDVMNGISIFIKKMKSEMVAMLTHPRSFPRMLWDKSLTTKFSYHPDVPLLILHAPSSK
jgi:nucleotide-binding universal stress UspA family protein